MESTTQIFLRVQVTDDEDDVVEGESNVGQYAGRVQIDNFTFKMSLQQQSGPKRSDNQPTLSFDTVKVSKFFDKSSIRFGQLLKQMKKQDQTLSEVRITIDQQLEDPNAGDNAAKQQNAIVVFHLLQARIVDISLDASEADNGTTLKETIDFSFRNFAVEYYFSSDRKKSDYRDAPAWFETDYKLQPTQ